MPHKLLATAAGQRTFALIFETGDEILERLRAFARAERLAGSHFTAIGACSEVILGYFEWASRQYRPIPVHEQVEVSLIGDIALAPTASPRCTPTWWWARRTVRRMGAISCARRSALRSS